MLLCSILQLFEKTLNSNLPTSNNLEERQDFTGPSGEYSRMTMAGSQLW